MTDLEKAAQLYREAWREDIDGSSPKVGATQAILLHVARGGTLIEAETAIAELLEGR